MAAGAYGAVVSLMHVLENLQHPSRQHLHYDKNQIQTLSENLTFLLDFFEDYSEIVCQTDDVVDLARQIAYAVDEAEEIIDYHVVDQIISYHAMELLSQVSETSGYDEAEENVDRKVAVDNFNQGSESSDYDEEEANIGCEVAVDQLGQGSKSSDYDEAEENIGCKVAVDQLSQDSESSDNVGAKEKIDCKVAADQLSQGSNYDEAEDQNDDNHVVDQLSHGSGYDDEDHAVDQLSHGSGYDDEYAVDQLSQGSSSDVDKGLSSFREDLEIVLNRIESIKRELMLVIDREREVKVKPQLRVFVPDAGSSAPPSTSKMNTMVGFDDHMVRIMELLKGGGTGLQIVSITGMGGIGKTTLARNVFDNRCIVDHFDLRKWMKISQSYSIQEVLISLVGESDSKANNQSNQFVAELGGKLHKMLYGRRYLIIMDDVWSTEVWKELQHFFPNNKNGSRVIVTTRLSNVAVSLGSHNPYLMPFLDEETSWMLFCTKVFGKQVCPNPELEKIGKKIVECCKGLPLAISIIGGLLEKSNMIRDDWEFVAKDVLKSLDYSKEDGDCSNILSLSYKHLPIHLKPCFLYMRYFSEDEEISVGDLINYWVAEGFVKLKDGQTLEEVALEYLKDLIDRSLILMHELNEYTGDISKCKVHDLLRDLCMKEYENESVFVISKVCKIDHNAEYDTCFLCSYRKASTWTVLPQVCRTTTTLVCCFVCYVCDYMCFSRNRLRLFKVADVGNFMPSNLKRLRLVKFDDDDDDDDYEALKPTRLRYLKIKFGSKFNSTALHLLWNVQFFDILDLETMPTAIWEMPQLRHLIGKVDSPSTQTGRKDGFSLEKLQLLSVIVDQRGGRWFVAEILKRIPNVKTLDIAFTGPEFHNVAQLHKLQHLVCKHATLEYISFPDSLKVLELDICSHFWEGMTIIGSLPNLEVLVIKRPSGKLEWDPIKRELFMAKTEWNPIEGEFLRLKTLSIQESDLVRWNAEKNHFPRLEMLELVRMSRLEEIPSGIGDIDTLRLIRLRRCTESTVQSAKEIIAEQRDNGNEELQLDLPNPVILIC